MLGTVGSRISHAQQALRYTLRGQAFWACRFWDGREVFEWEVDWSLLPQKGLRQVRLHCPNGLVPILESSQSLEGRAMQWKDAVAFAGPRGRHVERQVIALLTGTNGEACAYWWDYATRALVGPVETTVEPGRLGALGTTALSLCFEHLGARPD